MHVHAWTQPVVISDHDRSDDQPVDAAVAHNAAPVAAYNPYHPYNPYPHQHHHPHHHPPGGFQPHQYPPPSMASSYVYPPYAYPPYAGYPPPHAAVDASYAYPYHQSQHLQANDNAAPTVVAASPADASVAFHMDATPTSEGR